MNLQNGKRFNNKRFFWAIRSASAVFLSMGLVFSSLLGASAQVVAVDPLPPCCVFQKEPGFASRVNARALEEAQSVSQSYYDLIRKYDPLDPDPNKIPIFVAEVDYSLDASLDKGNGRVYSFISSMPFRPGGPVFHGTTNMVAGYTEPGKSLVGDERFSFSGFEGNTQRGSALAGGLGFYTKLIQGNAYSHVEYDTVTRQFEGVYLGEGIGAAGIDVQIGAVSGETGVGSSSQSYGSSITVEGDYRVRYSVSGGPPGGCLWGW